MTNQSEAQPAAGGSTSTTSGRIVVGIDASAASLTALALGIRLSRALGMSVAAVAAWQDEVVLDVPIGDPDLAAAASRTLSRAAAHAFSGPWPSWFQATVQKGEPAQVLVEESATAEFLIIGHSRHRALTRLLHGSVSAYCVTHAHCPVIVVP